MTAVCLWLYVTPQSVSQVWQKCVLMALCNPSVSQAWQKPGPSGRVQLTLERGDDGRFGLAAPPAEPQDVPLLAPGRGMAQALGARAVEWLWGLLREACALGVVPDAWQEGAGAEHPFLAWRAEPPGWFVVRV